MSERPPEPYVREPTPEDAPSNALFGLGLFAIVFYWTPPHFWALALRYRGDYAAANVPMLPVVRGEAVA